MPDIHDLKTEIAVLKHEKQALRDLLIDHGKKLDEFQRSQTAKLDAIQISMSSLYQVFVTQKDFNDMKERVVVAEKKLAHADVRAAFIAGVGFFAVLIKDYLVEGAIRLISKQ